MDERRNQLGDFEILRELGRGGMGVVYEATQKSLNRRVALKVLSTGLGPTTKAIMRFKREAEAAAKLHHTNIVPIYATGEENRTPFYAMELIDGPSLDQVIRQFCQAASEPLPDRIDSTHAFHEAQSSSNVHDWVADTIGFGKPESDAAGSSSNASISSSSWRTGGQYYDNVARMMAEVADALAHAHDQGVIHRDIKPSNLLLSADGRLSVNDFGLARMLEQPGMTISGELMGSPMYMSPEQIAAGRLPLDHRTDIYSLGATLYELLTLRPPFDGRQRDQVLSQIVHKEPIRPRAVNMRIPKDLETICLKAMEKDPDRRYQTADKLADDLNRFVDRHAISARRIGPVERGVRWAKRHKALAASLACLLLLVGVAGTFAWQAQVAEQRRIEQEEEYKERERQRNLEDAKERALTAAMSGDFPAAERAIAEVELQGAVAWSRMLRGQVALFQGDMIEALKELQTAVMLDQQSVAARAMLATANVYAGQWAEYGRILVELEKMEPTETEDYLFLGKALTFVDRDKALGLLDTARAKRPGSGIVRASRSDALTHKATFTHNPKFVDQAIVEADLARTLLPDNPIVENLRCLAYVVAARVYQANQLDAAGLLDEAGSSVEVLKRFQDFALGYAYQVWYYEALGDETKALQAAREAVARGGRGWIASNYAAKMYRSGRSQEALEFLDREITESRSPYVDQARALLIAEIEGDPDRAAEDFKRVSANGLHGDMTLAVVSLLLHLGQQEAARSTSLRILETQQSMLQPEFLATHRYLADQIGLDELLQAAGNNQRRLANIYSAIATKFLVEGERDKAREYFRKAEEADLYMFTPGHWAGAFLSRMEDENWPKWLPSKQNSF